MAFNRPIRIIHAIGRSTTRGETNAPKESNRLMHTSKPTAKQTPAASLLFRRKVAEGARALERRERWLVFGITRNDAYGGVIFHTKGEAFPRVL